MSPGLRRSRLTTPSEALKSNEMPETSTQHGKSFAENLDILFNELVLATQWGRPSVLLAVNKSKFGQEKAEKALEARLKKQGLEVARIVVNDQRPDVPALIKQAGGKPVFFISNLDWGGGDQGAEAYRALNMQRELFVENRVKAVLWLTTAEAANLARQAPDFWAFRHRVVEFVSQRSPAAIKLPSGVLLWDMQTAVEIFDSPAAGIQAREDLLSRLPRTQESLSARAELYYSIGYLRWTAGDLQRAAGALQSGLDLAADHPLPELRSRLLNGVGIVRYDSRKYAEALEAFQQGLQLNPSSVSLLINLGAVSGMLGRKQEATASAKKAIAASPTNAESLERVGYILASMGRPDEAIRHIIKAVELAPRVSRYRAALAVLYSVVDRADEARPQLESARSLPGASAGRYLEILQAAILGDAGKARDLLRAAVESKEMAAHDIRRDPNLAMLLDVAQLAEFSE